MTKVIMHGCNGRMGQVITNLCSEEARIEIVAGVDRSVQVKQKYPVFATIEECKVEADVGCCPICSRCFRCR